jgi:hypothetical protein
MKRYLRWVGILMGFFIDMEVAFALGHFQHEIKPIPESFMKIMEKYTWHAGCPVPLKDLAYVTVSYWGFDQKTHSGVLIVNNKLAPEVVDIFHELYDEKFPIASIKPVEIFKGNDEASMAANNTSAFNCRPTTTFPNQFSLHSYGCAIDINTLINPYVKNEKVLPPGGKIYLNRDKPVPGMIIKGDKTYQAFIKRGWEWGGDWSDRQDYQHFQKKSE